MPTGTPPSLRPVSLADDTSVAVFTIPSGGDPLLLSAPALRDALGDLPESTTVVAFGHESSADLRPALALLRSTASDAVCRPAPATEAVKLVADGTVIRSVDRRSLFVVRMPEVVRRATLEQVLDQQAGDPINPTAAVAAAGGRIAFLDTDESSAPHDRADA